MNRLLLVAIIMVILISVSLASVELDGFGRVRSYSREEYDFDRNVKDNLKQTEYRFQVGIRLSKGQGNGSYVYLQPRFSKNAGDNSITQTSGALNDPDSFEAHQAFLAYKKDKLTLIAGRQELNYGDQLVIGAAEWHNAGRSFDGYKISFDNGLGKTDILMMKIKENGAQVDADRDHDLSGIYHNGKLYSIDSFDLYYLEDNDQLDKASDNQVHVRSTGLRAKFLAGDFDYRAEFTSQSIKFADTSEAAYQYDIEFGYKLKNLRIALENSLATEHYRQLYPTAHKWLGVADLFKRQNIAESAFHLKYYFNNMLDIKLSWHIFNVDNKEANTHRWMYTGSESTHAKELGNEQDFVLNYKLDEITDLQFVYGQFFPGERFKKEKNNDQLSFSYLQLETAF